MQTLWNPRGRSPHARAALALRHDVAPGRRRHPRGVMAGECLIRHPAHEHAVLRRAVGTDARQSTHRAESRGRLRRRAERRERQQEEPEHHVVQAQRPEEESGVGGGLERRITQGTTSGSSCSSRPWSSAGTASATATRSTCGTCATTTVHCAALDQ